MIILIYIYSYLKKINKKKFGIENIQLDNTPIYNHIDRQNIKKSNIREDLDLNRRIVNETYINSNDLLRI